MKIGLLVPVVYRDPADVTELASRADLAGVDGVFAVDHASWKGQPVLSHIPVLTLLATSTTKTHIGSLVMRVGVRPRELAVRELVTIQRMSGGRLIAGLGVGDSSSQAENELYGIEPSSFADRLKALGEHCEALTAESIDVWVGGRSTGVAQVAIRCGVAVNLWQAPPEEVRAAAAATEVTWAGKVGDSTEATDQARALEDAGATWMVVLAGGNRSPAEAVDLTVGLKERLRR